MDSKLETVGTAGRQPNIDSLLQGIAEFNGKRTAVSAPRLQEGSGLDGGGFAVLLASIPRRLF